MCVKRLIQPHLDYLEEYGAWLRHQYPGQWVLLHQGTLVAAFDTVQAAQEHARAQHFTHHMILYID